MASRVGLIVRTTAARDRTDAALASIFAKQDLGSLEAQPPRERDADVAAMLREEWLADVLEAIAYGVPISEEADGGEPDADDDRIWATPGFVDMSRDDLEKVAVEWYQIDPAEYPDDMALRQALVAAYEEETGGSDESEPDAPLDTLKLDVLKARAIEAGHDADRVNKMRSKKEVIAILAETDTPTESEGK